MKFYLLGIGIIILMACSKKDIATTPNPPTPIFEEPIKFEVNPDISSGKIDLTTDTIEIKVNVSSKLPTAGLIYSVEVKRADSNLITYKIDSTSLLSSLTLKVHGFNIKANYNVKITVASKSTISNTSFQNVQISRGRIYKNYLKTSYELFNSTQWFSSNNLFNNGTLYFKDNPLLVPQTAQVDLNGDGLEDIITFDSYDLNLNSRPDPPPSIFMNADGVKFNKVNWNGPTIKNPHGFKLLVGDFNNDSLPDIFSLVATDPQNNTPQTFSDNCHLLLNSTNGFNKVIEFPELGYWYSGSSGDIDKDGDLDIVMFNFGILNNRVKNQILWNDGKANFVKDQSGIGDLAVVSSAELIDINHDGFLDLVINKVRPLYNPCPCVYVVDVIIMWGNGKSFSLYNSSSFITPTGFILDNISSADLDGDAIDEIILAGYDGMNTKFWLEFYKSDDKGKSFLNKTSQYFDDNKSSKRFDIIRFQDIDKNGKMDIFAPDKKDNIRWEWDGSKFIKK